MRASRGLNWRSPLRRILLAEKIADPASEVPSHIWFSDRVFEIAGAG